MTEETQTAGEPIPHFLPTLPEGNPTKYQIVGRAREFIDEFEENIRGDVVYNSLGIKPDKNFLLYSEPGLGKTISLRALNNSLNTQFLTNFFNKKMEEIRAIKKGEEVKMDCTIRIKDLKLVFFEYDIGRYGTSYINRGSRVVQAFFNQVFASARMGVPTLASLDEGDATLISRKSSIQSHSEDRKVLETIMKNLQTAHDLDNVYTVIMTNTPEIIDEAALRAGRIDRKIKFEMPDFYERKSAYENAIQHAGIRAGYRVIRKYRSEILAEMSSGFSYADIVQSVEQALREKAKELIRNKEPGILRAGYIKQNSLEEAIKKHKIEFREKNNSKIGFLSKQKGF